MSWSAKKPILRKVCFLTVTLMVFWSMNTGARERSLHLSGEEKTWLTEHPTLRLGVGVAFPPYMWVEKKDGRHIFKGMVSDYVDLLGERLGVDMQIVFGIPFNEALAQGKAGRIDFFPCLSKTPEREHFLLFTKPYLSYPLMIITREDAPILGGVEDLKGKRFAVVKHLFLYSRLQNDYPNLDLNYVFTHKVEENLEAVSLGRADACIINLAVASYYIRKKGLTNLKIAASVNWKGVELCMGVRKDWPVLQGIIEKALASISQEEKDQISQHWIRAQYEPGVAVHLIWRWSLGIGAGIVVLFSLFYFWNRRLQKEILEKEKAEHALKESERKISTLMGNLPGIAYRCLNDKAWTMLYISDGCKDLTGYEPSEIIENSTLAFNDLIVREDRQHVWNEIQMAVNEDRPFKIEYRIRDKNQNERWVWEKGRRVAESKGDKFVLEGFISDITERKKAEASISKSNALLTAVINQAPFAIHILEGEFSNIHVVIENDESARIMGEAVAGRRGIDADVPEMLNTRFFSIDGKQEIPLSRMPSPRALKGEIVNNEEFLFRHADGTQIMVEASASPIYDTNNQIMAVAVVFQDITERKEAEKESEKLRHQLTQSQKMEAVGTLAGGIAHDFNNILAVILGNTELASFDVPDSNPAAKSLKAIHQASIRAKDMVHQLLAFSRKVDEETKPLSMAPIIKESMKMLRSAIPTSVTFKQHISDDSCGVMGDAAQINQIVMNLVTNAAHAMSEEGGPLEVTLENITFQEEKSCFDWVLSPGKYVRLKVRDTGDGIEPTIIDRIFEPYYTTKEVGKGTGMGLSVVHGIVKRHGGGIRVESELGEGTVFEIYFPALENAVEEEKEPEGEIKGGPERILFVDDEESLVNLNHQRLERLGYKVKSTTEPVEALEWFRADPDQFDVIITDMTMPRMTGDRLAAEVLKIRPHLSVIICTGYSERMSEKKAKDLGVRKYIEKPTDLRNLAASIREVLEEG